MTTAAAETVNSGRVKPSISIQVLKVICDYCEETSVHGLGQVIRNTNTTAKILWLIFFFVAVISNIYHCSILIEMYLDYPMQEVTRTEHSSISFPDVTICNLDAVSGSNYERMLQNKSSRLSRYLAKTRKMRDIGVVTDEEFDEISAIIMLRVNIGEEETKAIGHQIEDLVLRCTFRGKSCPIRNYFKWTSNPFLYNCYTFEPGLMGDNFVAIGPANGLSLILYLEADEGVNVNIKYNKRMKSGNALGLKVMLHPRHSYPNANVVGMDMMPGHSTSIAFSVTRSKKLPLPHGDCIYNESLSGIVGYKYSTALCLDLCLDRHGVDKCTCKNVEYSNSDDKQDIYCGTLSNDTDLQK